MKWIALLQAVLLFGLVGCSVNDDSLYSPANPYASPGQPQYASAVPDDGMDGRSNDPSNHDPSAIDEGASHAGRYVGDYGVPVVTVNRPKDVIILADNCAKLEMAVKEFAARTGRYPENVDADRTPDGKTVIDLLSALPRNPYSGAREAPVNHSAVRPGQIGYAVVYGEHRNPPSSEGGYVITARTRLAGTLACSNLGYPTPELIVISHARTVQLAVERFANENNGVYPSDICCDQTDRGHTVVDLLPEGCLLENPVHKYQTEPVDGVAANRGEIGYSPAYRYGGAYDYNIYGVGMEPGTIIVVIDRSWVTRVENDRSGG